MFGGTMRTLPNLIILAMGNPKQEIVAKIIAASVQSPVVIVNGGAVADFLAGRFERAPLWVRRARLEWAFQLLQEPRRLCSVAPISAGGRFVCMAPDAVADGSVASAASKAPEPPSGMTGDRDQSLPKILVIGASGFVGAAIVRAAMTSNDIRPVACMRASSQALNSLGIETRNLRRERPRRADPRPGGRNLRRQLRPGQSGNDARRHPQPVRSRPSSLACGESSI